MKKNIGIFLLVFISMATRVRGQAADTTRFSAERWARTATIITTGNIRQVFPLFGAFAERKWAMGWNPTLIYPRTETMEEGTTFRTPGHGHGENTFIWTVSKYDTLQFLVQYLVWSENRYWTISIECKPWPENKTASTITYSFTGLNALGNAINEHSIESIYHHHLKDWEEAINYYVEQGKMKPDQ